MTLSTPSVFGSCAARVALGIALACVLAGCSREREDWRSAQTADTVESYEQFLQQHPDSARATEARGRVEQLVEDRDWQAASTADAVAAYQQFLAQHPEGKWSQEARIRIENLNIAAVPDPALAPAPAPDSGAPPVTTPAKPPTQPAQAATFAIQLGAFSTPSAADAHWKQIAGQFKAELGPLSHKVSSAKSSTGDIYRLQAAVPDEQHARDLCARLKAKSQGCVVVLP